MARRPVFQPNPTNGPGDRVQELFLDFQWHPGFSIAQKQKNVAELHEAARLAGISNVLEVSSKSREEPGQLLSAFRLKVTVPGVGRVPLESAFQGSKVFVGFGTCRDLYMEPPRDAKRKARERNRNDIIHFEFGKDVWPLEPKTAFYDWLYLKSLTEPSNSSLLQSILRYSAFTDIEFNPKKSFNCQARSCALTVALHSKGLLGTAVESKDSFLKTLRLEDNTSTRIVPIEQTRLL